MSPQAIPNFDQFQPKKVTGPVTVGGKVPSFDDWNPDEKLSPAQEFGSTLVNHAGGLIPGIASTVKGLATHPIDTAGTLLRNLINTPQSILTDLTGHNFGQSGGFGQPDQAPGENHVGRGLENLMELAAPFALKGMGKVVEAGAEPMAELAGRVRSTDRAFDANPGRAVIRETTSPTVKGTSRQLGEKASTLSTQLTRAASDATARGAMGDLLPARAAVEGPLENARLAGATETAKQLDKMHSFVKGDAPPGFGGDTLSGRIHPMQPPDQLLRMRQEFPTNFSVNYGPNVDSRIEGIGRNVNRALSDQVKATVPEAKDLDQRVQDLISAQGPYDRTANNAGFAQRAFGRLAAHTGALTGAFAGYHLGGIPGMMAGFAVPEIAASPDLQLMTGRGMDFTGRALQNPGLTVPATLGLKSTQKQQ